MLSEGQDQHVLLDNCSWFWYFRLMANNAKECASTKRVPGGFEYKFGWETYVLQEKPDLRNNETKTKFQ